MSASSVFDMFLQYIGHNYVLGILFVVSVTYYICKAFRTNKKQGIATLLVGIFFFLTVFNPLLYKYLATIADGGASYYRFIWSIPLVAISACFLTEIVFFVYQLICKRSASKQSKHPHLISCVPKTVSIVTALLLSAVILFSGTSYLTADNLSVPENKFNISRAALDISQFIQDDPDHVDGDVVLAPTQIMMELLTYDITIVPALPRTEYINYKKTDSVYEPLLSLILEGPESTWHHFENVRYNCQSLNVDYIVTLTLFDLDTYMEFLNYPLYNRTGDYSVYRRRDK
ncbi:MAG: hypothetical protein IJZ85_06795 [Lachnospiraceae bacterium]|nr:hypothetical protein [Lachnospiraceae bacterium]